MNSNVGVIEVPSDISSEEKESCRMCSGFDEIAGYNGSGWPICRRCSEFHNIPLQPYLNNK